MIFIQVFMANMGATVFVVLMIVVTLMITWNSVLSKIIDFIGKHIIEPLIDIIGNMIRDIIPSDERLKENITLMGHSDEDHSIDVYNTIISMMQKRKPMLESLLRIYNILRIKIVYQVINLDY